MTLKLGPYRTSEIMEISEGKNAKELMEGLVQWAESTQFDEWEIQGDPCSSKLFHKGSGIHIYETTGWGDVHTRIDIFSTGDGDRRNQLPTTWFQRRRLKKLRKKFLRDHKDIAKINIVMDAAKKIESFRAPVKGVKLLEKE